MKKQNCRSLILKVEFYTLSPDDWFYLLFKNEDVDRQLEFQHIYEDYKNGDLYDQLYDEEIDNYLDIYCWDKLEKIYTLDFCYLSKHSFYFDNTESKRHYLVSTWFNSLSKNDFELYLTEFGLNKIFFPRIKKIITN